MTVAQRADYSESHAAIQSLAWLVHEHGIRGINVWHYVDDVSPEVQEHWYVVEAGPKKFSDFTLPYVLMRAAGRMPTKFCPGCERDLDLSLFVKRNSSSDGLGSICNECNRRNVKKHYEGRRARLQAALTGGNQDAA